MATSNKTLKFLQGLAQTITSAPRQGLSSIAAGVEGVGELGGAGIASLLRKPEQARAKVSQANSALTRERDFGFLGKSRPFGMDPTTGNPVKDVVKGTKDIIGGGLQLGAFAAPVGLGAQAPSMGAALLSGAGRGALQGSLAAGGQALSEDDDLKQGLIRTGTGALAGGLVGGALSGAQYGMPKVIEALRGGARPEAHALYRASPDLPTEGNFKKGTYFADSAQKARYYAESHYPGEPGDIQVQQFKLPKDSMFKEPSTGNYITKGETPVEYIDDAFAPRTDGRVPMIGKHDAWSMDLENAPRGEILNPLGGDDVKPTAPAIKQRILELYKQVRQPGNQLLKKDVSDELVKMGVAPGHADEILDLLKSRDMLVGKGEFAQKAGSLANFIEKAQREGTNGAWGNLDDSLPDAMRASILPTDQSLAGEMTKAGPPKGYVGSSSHVSYDQFMKDAAKGRASSMLPTDQSLAKEAGKGMNYDELLTDKLKLQTQIQKLSTKTGKGVAAALKRAKSNLNFLEDAINSLKK